MSTNRKLHRKQNNSTVTTGVSNNINLHFVFSSVFVRELGQKTPDKWKTRSAKLKAWPFAANTM